MRGITLWVFGEGRYEAANFANAEIHDSDLVWNYDTGHSNYPEVFQSTLRANDNGHDERSIPLKKFSCSVEKSVKHCP